MYIQRGYENIVEIKSPSLLYEEDKTINGNTIGAIIGIIIVIVVLTIFIAFIAYCLPWLRCYNLCCWRCAACRCCDCINCFYVCPCLETRAYNRFLAESIRSNRVYEQNFLTTSDGRIIQGI